MKQVIWNNLNELEQVKCLKRPVPSRGISAQENVAAILEDVKKNGDVAIKKYAEKFDKVKLNEPAVSQSVNDLDPQICQSIQSAYKNIRKFHEQQGFKSYEVETTPGVNCRRIVRQIERIGLYVPGGTAPLVSTTLMLGIPAQIAGCPQITLCTPCDQDGNINPYILYAAQLCSIIQIFRIGGAQAIAAMAYGTQTIPKVDKIFGPGNAYVTEAKIQVSRDPQGAAIDMPAGPSEVCVIADDTTNSAFAAADLLSQAEHDVLSQVLLITVSQKKAKEVIAETERQLQALPRNSIATQALKNSTAIVASGIAQALEISNLYAPEHLILCFEGAEKYFDQVINAGSVFLGPWTPEAAGDYATGTNHVLPTYGYVRSYSGLGVEAFQKTITIQEITRSGLKNIGSAVENLAMLEGLKAHANAINIRLREKS